MARTINEIKRSMTDVFIANPQVIADYSLDTSKTFDQEFSTVSIESILFGCVATGIWVMESLFDKRDKEAKAFVELNRGPYTQFYIEKAKDFQYGYDLAPNQIYYDNTGLPPADIEASKIVKYAAAIGVTKGVRIKIAGETSGELAPVGAAEFAAFDHYMNRIKPPGQNLYLVNLPPDQLRLNLTIYFNPLVLDPTGKRRDGTNDTPVFSAINAFLRNQPFDGLFVLAKLVDTLQLVEGVVIPDVNEAAARYGVLNYMDIDVSYLPDSGYLRLSEFTVNYLPHAPIN